MVILMMHLEVVELLLLEDKLMQDLLELVEQEHQTQY